MLKPTQIQADLIQYAVTSLSDPKISEKELSKVVKIVGTVIVSLDGLNLDYLEWYAIVGKRDANIRIDLLGKATSIYSIILASL